MRVAEEASKMEEPDKDSGVEEEEFKAGTPAAAKAKAEQGVLISD